MSCLSGVHACVVHARGVEACPANWFCLYDDRNYNTEHVNNCWGWEGWWNWRHWYWCDGGHSDLMLITDLRTHGYHKWPNENFPVGNGQINFGDYLANGEDANPTFAYLASSYVNSTDHQVDVKHSELQLHRLGR